MDKRIKFNEREKRNRKLEIKKILFLKKLDISLGEKEPKASCVTKRDTDMVMAKKDANPWKALINSDLRDSESAVNKNQLSVLWKFDIRIMEYHKTKIKNNAQKLTSVV